MSTGGADLKACPKAQHGWEWQFLWDRLSSKFTTIEGSLSPVFSGDDWLIAIGALLPGIGGAFTRAGYVEVLYVGELIGLILIFRGYRLIAGDRAPSIHPTQQTQ